MGSSSAIDGSGAEAGFSANSKSSSGFTVVGSAAAADAFLPKGACSPAEMIERIRVLVARKRGPRKAYVAPHVEHEAAAAMAS